MDPRCLPQPGQPQRARACHVFRDRLKFGCCFPADFLRPPFTPAGDTRDESKHVCGVCVCVAVCVCVCVTLSVSERSWAEPARSRSFGRSKRVPRQHMPQKQKDSSLAASCACVTGKSSPRMEYWGSGVATPWAPLEKAVKQLPISWSPKPGFRISSVWQP